MSHSHNHVIDPRKPCQPPHYRLCHLVRTNAAYHAKYALAGTHKPVQPHIVKATKPLPCVHLGEPTGATAACAEGCGLGMALKVFACNVYGECTIAKHGTEVKGCCRRCPDYKSPPPALTVNQGAGGLGDALMGACAVNGLRRLHSGRPIVYKAGNHTLQFLKLFDLGQTTFAGHDWDDGNERPAGDPNPGDLQMNTGYGHEIATKGRFTRLERNCRNLGGVTPEIPIPRDRQKLLAAGADFAGAVVLSPFSTWHAREYPLDNWLRVEKLLREEGYRVVVLDATDSRFPGRHKPLRSESVIDAPASRVAGIMLNAACVVGNDSGLAHLGGILGTQTLVLCVGIPGGIPGQAIYGFYDAIHRNMHYLDEPIAPEQIVAAVSRIAGPPAPPPYGETCKAHARRLQEGWYASYIKAPCLDVGCWVDPLLPGFPCTRWDQMFGDGDAMLLSGVPDGSFATCYASHVLEHVADPVLAMRNWYRVLRPGGHLIVCVPARDLYEGQRDLPSRWNRDHKTYWLLEAPEPTDPPHTRGLRQCLHQAIPGAQIVSLRILDSGYDCPAGAHPQGEFSIEAIVRKPPFTV